MVKKILSKQQQKFLNFFAQNRHLTDQFYFTGGTCLSAFYLKHRYSEDLDFFSCSEFNVTDVTSILNSHKKILGVTTITFQQSFNRNIYFLTYKDRQNLKVEFTYFPFEQIEKNTKIKKMPVDSLLDIAVNKLFTIYQNPRGRDYFDLFFILKKQQKLTIMKLISLARIKFDTDIDYVQLGSQLLKVTLLKDDPILVDSIHVSIIEEFIYKEAGKLKKEFLKE